ncbi:MAG: hypothetical protein NC218_11935 [Acetobacter sp.]|nr:hypothetical protein [Acetobacter sp.]MCM1324266.1 hypothetical protein [Acetobacter sp.]MCM1324694.1 hypothetical protein [Acetobacter sp.]MCM1324817.1 hypothetical protein [Acetobacter sp.]
MTFTFTLEELNHRHQRMKTMRKKFKTKIAAALLQERISRKLKLEEVSTAIKVLPERIESHELGIGKMRWEVIGMLLKYYGKTFEITLKDMPPQEK